MRDVSTKSGHPAVRPTVPDEDGTGCTNDPCVMDVDDDDDDSDDFVSAASPFLPLLPPTTTSASVAPAAPTAAISAVPAHLDEGFFRSSEGECPSAGACSIDGGASDSVYDWV